MRRDGSEVEACISVCLVSPFTKGSRRGSRNAFRPDSVHRLPPNRRQPSTLVYDAPLLSRVPVCMHLWVTDIQVHPSN